MNVRTLCLGILSLGEATGYEIKKGIEDGMFSHFIDASFGSIYPALTQLAAEGLLSVRAELNDLPTWVSAALTAAYYLGFLLGTKAVTDFPEKWTDLAKQRIVEESSYPMILIPFAILAVVLVAAIVGLVILNTL